MYKFLRQFSVSGVTSSGSSIITAHSLGNDCGDGCSDRDDGGSLEDGSSGSDSNDNSSNGDGCSALSQD